MTLPRQEPLQLEPWRRLIGSGQAAAACDEIVRARDVPDRLLEVLGRDYGYRERLVNGRKNTGRGRPR